MTRSFLSRFLVPVATMVLALSPVVSAQAATAGEIDAKVDAALTRFKMDVTGAESYFKAAKGVLVMPDVKKAGMVVGGQWGDGALRLGSKTADYYRMEAGSIGFQAGYQEANFLFVFLTPEALSQFRESKGWTAGVDAGITLVDVGTGVNLDTMKGKDAVVGFVFGKEGLMGGWSLKGAKFTKQLVSK